MEKKTIGKFISALRKANGLTQKELGEKLFVSDKTVSRWECNECTPELSLIPSIAEIFGITADELLRGERSAPGSSEDREESESRHRAKSDKQFCLMLDLRKRKYKNLTLISFGITIIGFLAAVVVNLGFSSGWIAFCLAAAFCVVSEISQICFAINAFIAFSEDTAPYKEKIQGANASILRAAVVISFINACTLTFCLPLVTLISGANEGLLFLSWLGNGLLFAFIALVVFYVLYVLLIRKPLLEKTEIAYEGRHLEDKKLLLKSLLRAGVIALSLAVCICVWYIIDWQSFLKEQTFDNCADFKAFMESDYIEWYKETYGTVLYNGVEVSDDYYHSLEGYGKMYFGITNAQGEEICSYYCNPDLYWKIEFTPIANDKMPVRVVTSQAVMRATNLFQSVETALYLLILADFIAYAGVYISKLRKIKPNS